MKYGDAPGWDCTGGCHFSDSEYCLRQQKRREAEFIDSKEFRQILRTRAPVWHSDRTPWPEPQVPACLQSRPGSSFRLNSTQSVVHGSFRKTFPKPLNIGPPMFASPRATHPFLNHSLQKHQQKHTFSRILAESRKYRPCSGATSAVGGAHRV